MECEETTVQGLAFIFQDSNLNLDARIAELLYSTPLNLSELIYTTDNHPPHTFLYNKVGTGRSLTIVRTWLERHIDGRLSQQSLILSTYRGKGIHLGMTFAAANMIPLTDYPPISTYYHCSYHRVGLRILTAIPCQLNAPAHIFLVFNHH